MRTGSRLLQTCSSLKMMAMVRTSLQKVVVFLHRLQRMAISSPRYQKLCKVCGHQQRRSRVDGEFLFLVFLYFVVNLRSIVFFFFSDLLQHTELFLSCMFVEFRVCLLLDLCFW